MVGTCLRGYGARMLKMSRSALDALCNRLGIAADHTAGVAGGR
jgi:hypothetical protein